MCIDFNLYKQLKYDLPGFAIYIYSYYKIFFNMLINITKFTSSPINFLIDESTYFHNNAIIKI